MSAKVLSLFSGAGGMDLGLEAAGFETVGCLEFDNLAKHTLAANRPNWPLIGNGDVVAASRELKPEALGLERGQLDLLAGGPPCQPFSAAAQWSANGRLGMSDDRADTVHALLDLVDSFLPRAVLIENVIGFVRGKNSALPAIQERLREIAISTEHDYSLHWKVLNSADYGVAQNRRRVIVVMLRDLDSWTWPEPDETTVTTWDVLSDLPEPSLSQPAGKWADLLPSIPAGENYQYLTAKGGGDELFGYRTKFWNFLLKLHPGEPSWTLSASPGPSTGPFHWNNRPLTPRERLRIQSFPDSWTLSGDLRSQIKLAGNATPPRLAWRLGQALASALQINDGTLGSMPIPRASAGLPKLPLPSKVPSKYAHLIGAKSPHPGHGLGPAGRGPAEPLQGRARSSVIEQGE